MSSFNQKNELYNNLNSICDNLRKTMDASEYRNYILGFIFYKYLSEKLEKEADKILKADNVKYTDLSPDGENEQVSIYNAVKDELLNKFNYIINKDNLFSTWVAKAKNNEDILSLVEESLRSLSNTNFKDGKEKYFKGLFNDINFNSSKLGQSEKAKNKTVSDIILRLSNISFDYDDAKIDILGDAYEHLIANFASEAGKKAGEFYTPQEVSELLAKIVTLNKTKISSAYDPTCGSGSLLLQVSKLAVVDKLYGQEVKDTTYNLARMNMFLRGIKTSDFEIANDDTIMNPAFRGRKFEAIVANPPFSLVWEPDETMLSDERFSDYGKLAPKGKMDYAFIQHMLYSLDTNGVMATVVPHGVLFRGASEATIRSYIVEKMNWLDAVIGLPENIFYGTSIPSCIMVFKKNRTKNDKILFIEASREFVKGKNQNKLSEENISKIIDSYKDRKEINKYSKLVSLDEIVKNDCNLNITRYVDTFDDDENIDIVSLSKELSEINSKIAEGEKEIEAMISELIETK